MKVKYGFFSYIKSSEGLNNDLKIKLENVKMKGTMHINNTKRLNEFHTLNLLVFCLVLYILQILRNVQCTFCRLY